MPLYIPPLYTPFYRHTLIPPPKRGGIGRGCLTLVLDGLELVLGGALSVGLGLLAGSLCLLLGLQPLGVLRLQRAKVLLLDAPAGALSGLVFLRGDGAKELANLAAGRVEFGGQFGGGQDGHVILLIFCSSSFDDSSSYHAAPRGCKFSEP